MTHGTIQPQLALERGTGHGGNQETQPARYDAAAFPQRPGPHGRQHFEDILVDTERTDQFNEDGIDLVAVVAEAFGLAPDEGYSVRPSGVPQDFAGTGENVYRFDQIDMPRPGLECKSGQDPGPGTYV